MFIEQSQVQQCPGCRSVMIARDGMTPRRNGSVDVGFKKLAGTKVDE